MLKLAIPLTLTFAVIAGCTEMTDYYPNAETVEIQGHAFFVEPDFHLGKNVYLAGLNDPGDGKFSKSIGLGLAALNVDAIEKVTGCKVIPETISGVGGGYIQTNQTRAAVDCSG